MTATIALNESLSSSVEVQGARLAGLRMPAAWTAAAVTLQGRTGDTGSWFDLYDGSGSELSVTVAASRWVVLSQALPRVHSIRLRSGTAASPVNQAAARDIELLFGW